MPCGPCPCCEPPPPLPSSSASLFPFLPLPTSVTFLFQLQSVYSCSSFPFSPPVHLPSALVAKMSPTTTASMKPTEIYVAHRCLPSQMPKPLIDLVHCHSPQLLDFSRSLEEKHLDFSRSLPDHSPWKRQRRCCVKTNPLHPILSVPRPIFLNR